MIVKLGLFEFWCILVLNLLFPMIRMYHTIIEENLMIVYSRVYMPLANKSSLMILIRLFHICGDRI